MRRFFELKSARRSYPDSAIELDDRYIIQPQFHYWRKSGQASDYAPENMPDGFRYSSETNDSWLDEKSLAKLLQEPRC